MKFIMVGMTTLVILLTSYYARAVEALSSAELASHCSHYKSDPAGKDAVFCVRYIQGFIDGAVATDERVVSNISNDNREESFSERAMRTRIGKMKLYGSTYYAEFCLGEPIQLKDIVGKVVADLANSKMISKEVLARNIVYQTLRTNYSCKETKTK